MDCVIASLFPMTGAMDQSPKRLIYAVGGSDIGLNRVQFNPMGFPGISDQSAALWLHIWRALHPIILVLTNQSDRKMRLCRRTPMAPPKPVPL
jgi:hypothetical protein